MKLFLLLFVSLILTAAPRTWYVRADGGTASQCTGLTDAPYPGTGTAQPCAFSNPFYLWTNDPDPQKAAETTVWKISGGDTVLLKSGTYPMGWKKPAFDTSSWWNYTGCRGNNHGCYNPPIPAGTAEQPTRILGEGWDKGCPAPTAVLSGRGATNTPLNISNTSYVEVACLEITDASQCRLITLSGEPYGCRNYTDDYAYYGILLNGASHDIDIHHLNIHGLGAVGIQGDLGPNTNIHDNRIFAAGNMGLNTDPGGQVPSTGPITISNNTVEYSGCVESYPVTSPSILACYDQAGANANGDGIGTVDVTGSLTITGNTVRHNQQDGIDTLYVKSADSLTITGNTIIDNEGQAIKAGGATNTIIRDNYIQTNCDRGLADYPDSAPGANKYVKGTCRGNDTLALMFREGTKTDFSHNTVVAASPNLLNIQCRTVYDTFRGDGVTTTFTLTYPPSLFYTTGGVYIYEADGKTRTPLRAGVTGTKDCSGGPCQVYYDVGNKTFSLVPGVTPPTNTQTLRVEYFAPSACATGALTVTNNIFRGYPRFSTKQYPGYLWQNSWPTGAISETWVANLICQFRNPVTHPGESYFPVCPGTWLKNEPPTPTTPSDLDALDLRLAPNSPARGAAVSIPSWPTAGPDIGVSLPVDVPPPPPDPSPTPWTTSTAYVVLRLADGRVVLAPGSTPPPAGAEILGKATLTLVFP